MDNDNEPLDEGAEPAREYNNPHNFVVPTHCPRRKRNAAGAHGSWEGHRWDQIAEYTELELFRLCFPEEYVERVMLPTTNALLRKPCTLSEFYKWLGCNFFMACFQGIADQRAWWSKEPVSMFEGAPFRLSHVVSMTRFLELTAAMRFTDRQAPMLEHDGFVNWFNKVRQMLDATGHAECRAR